jgi:hypothetical protein
MLLCHVRLFLQILWFVGILGPKIVYIYLPACYMYRPSYSYLFNNLQNISGREQMMIIINDFSSDK